VYSLRRRFEQNQEDCTFTVLAILPTATENLLDAIPVEQVLEELQKQKAERLSRSVGPSEIASSAPPSVAETNEDDAKSYSFQSESYVHASQIGIEGESTTGSIEGGAGTGERKTKRSKAQLWSEMKISCEYNVKLERRALANMMGSDNPCFHALIHHFAPHSSHTHPAEPTGSPQLSRIGRVTGVPTTSEPGVADKSGEPRRR
jgi:hypothetical protein